MEFKSLRKDVTQKRWATLTCNGHRNDFWRQIITINAGRQCLENAPNTADWEWCATKCVHRRLCRSCPYKWHPFIFQLFYLWAENAPCARVCIYEDACGFQRCSMKLLMAEHFVRCGVFFDYLWCNLLQFQKRFSFFMLQLLLFFHQVFQAIFFFLCLCSSSSPLFSLYSFFVLFLMPLDAHSTIPIVLSPIHSTFINLGKAELKCSARSTRLFLMLLPTFLHWKSPANDA